MVCTYPSQWDPQMLKVQELTNVELQAQNTPTLKLEVAAGTSTHPMLNTTGLLQVATVATAMETVAANNAVSVSTLAMPISSKRLAVDTSVTGLLIKFAV